MEFQAEMRYGFGNLSEIYVVLLSGFIIKFEPIAFDTLFLIFLSNKGICIYFVTMVIIYVYTLIPSCTGHHNVPRGFVYMSGITD